MHRGSLTLSGHAARSPVSGQKALMACAIAACVVLGMGGCGNQSPPPDASQASQGEGSSAEASTSGSRSDDPVQGVVRFGQPEPADRIPGTIRIATYNVENLFDDHDDPALSGRYEDAGETKPEAHREAVARAIHAIDADVLALQEVESERALRWFADEYLSDLGYRHIVSVDAGNERGIEQSVLSRFPVTEVESWPGLDLGGVHPERYGDRPNMYAGEPLTYRRSPLLVGVRVPAEMTEGEPYELTLVVVHHKSGRFNHYWREAEASTLVGILEELERESPERNIVVLGDFNATPDEASVEMYLDAGWVDPMEPIDEGEPEPEPTHASGRRIDLILANPQAAREVVLGSGFVLGTPIRPEGMDWRSTPAPQDYASDHFPVVVDLRPVDNSP